MAKKPQPAGVTLECSECGSGRVVEAGRMYYTRPVELAGSSKDPDLLFYGETHYEPTEGSPDSYECDSCGHQEDTLRPFIVKVN